MESSNEGETDPGWFVGVDVGGTSIKIGIVSGKGKTVAKPFDEFNIPTHQHLGPADAIERIRDALNPAFESNGNRIKSVGLGTPGPLEVRRGMILDPVNLPGWRNFAIRDALSNALNRPVTYVNDANAAAFGEYWVGKGRDYENLVLVTLGTGVGTGIICHDRLISGANDHAAECGHITVDFSAGARICSCGKAGHLEAYASASAVALRAGELAVEQPETEIGRVLRETGELTARDVFDAAVKNDPPALSIIDQAASYLGRGVANIVHTVDPGIILLGGAMNFGGTGSAIGQRFLDAVDRAVRPVVFSRIAENLKIEFASLGSSAGWIGAAGLAKRTYDESL